jgi:hypothetical protein
MFNNEINALCLKIYFISALPPKEGTDLKIYHSITITHLLFCLFVLI